MGTNASSPSPATRTIGEKLEGKYLEYVVERSGGLFHGLFWTIRLMYRGEEIGRGKHVLYDTAKEMAAKEGLIWLAKQEQQMEGGVFFLNAQDQMRLFFAQRRDDLLDLIESIRKETSTEGRARDIQYTLTTKGKNRKIHVRVRTHRKDGRVAGYFFSSSDTNVITFVAFRERMTSPVLFQSLLAALKQLCAILTALPPLSLV